MKNPVELEYFKNYKHIIGIDEAGRGPWAGPMFIAGVLLSIEDLNKAPKVDDSKKLRSGKRELLHKEILNWSTPYVVKIAPKTIDKDGLTKSLTRACELIVETFQDRDGLDLKETLIIQDGKISYLGKFEHICQTEVLVSADSKSVAVAAASIVAKVERDNLMNKLSIKYPEYGFDKNKGYATKDHLEAVRLNGLTPIHRKSWDLKDKL
jgi:ribonuclease HII